MLSNGPCCPPQASLDDTTLAALSAPPSAALNQFPGEECLVFKNLLARTAAACPGTRRWLPETFDLDTQAQAMVGAHFEAGGGAQPPLWCAAQRSAEGARL